MAIDAVDFSFNGQYMKTINSDYMIFDFNPSDETTALERTINHNSITNDSYIQHYYGHVADRPLSIDITIGRCEEDILTRNDVNALSKWQMGESSPKVLQIIPSNDDLVNDSAFYSNICYIGSFTSMTYTQLGTTKRIGVTFHFENISPYGFTQEWSQTVDYMSESAAVLTMNNPYATGEIIWPTIEVTPRESGVLGIDCGQGNPFRVKMVYGTPFIIRDRCMYHKSNGSFYDFDTYLENFNWPYLKDGENNWVISGNYATVKVTSRWLVPLGY